jgi:hypothetical protein
MSNYFGWNGQEWISCSSCSRRTSAKIKPGNVYFVVRGVTLPTNINIADKDYYLIPDKVILNITENQANLLTEQGLGDIVEHDEAIKHQGYFV